MRADDIAAHFETTRPAASEHLRVLVDAQLLSMRREGTYSTYGRGIDLLNAACNYIDLVPKGRDEGAGIMHWLRRHDEYPS